MIAACSTIDEAGDLWQPERPYLNTATFGLPPTPAFDALQQALADWRHGRTSWEHWCDATDRSRELFGQLVGVPAERVATGASLSYLVGLIASGIPDGARCSCRRSTSRRSRGRSSFRGSASTSGRRRSTACRRHRPGTDVVAFSAVQSADGAVADLDGIAAAAAAHGTFTVVDASQAVSWLPVDGSRFDAVACAAYKWLMSPRGTAFLALSDRALEQTPPTRGQLVRRRRPLRQLLPPRSAAGEQTPGGSTSHPHGSPGSARSRPCGCSPRSASTRSTSTTSGSRTAFEAASV